MPHISVGEFSLHYKERGAGFPIVLIHGYTGNLRNWVLQVRSLSGSYRTISPDIRGHGLSARPDRPEGYALNVLATDVHGLLQALSVTECYLVGHSMGGMVAQEFVLQYPEMVKALVLVDTAADAPENMPLEEQARLIDLARREGMEAVFEEMLISSPLTPALVKENSEYIGLWREQFLMTSVEAYVYCAQAIASRPLLLDALSRISVPTLIVCGALDEPFLGPSRRMHQRIQGSELVIIEGCGHTPALEKPSELAQALLSFFARVDAQRSEEAPSRQ